MSESVGISRQGMVMSLAKLEIVKWENNVFSGRVDRYNLSTRLRLATHRVIVVISQLTPGLKEESKDMCF